MTCNTATRTAALCTKITRHFYLSCARARVKEYISHKEGQKMRQYVVLHLFGPVVFALWLLPVQRGVIIKKKCAILFRLNEFGGRFLMNM
jgi:hypothetical protein